MTTLHLLARATESATADCRLACARGDRILLLEDGVYLALGSRSPAMTDLVPDCTGWFALREHALERGLQHRLHPQIELISQEGFVALACEHARVVSWYR